ncbi:hypothetical protein [Pedobacter miscanthi]|uniref:Tetratricopeptide repeat protein n=1 Tax=Pedobacter miscanthi TaxID=2259170 RepID=A0A366L0T9_9SPHI|nr:hypothetical protein [Pedobacter miscanthi]RBQ06914.1 hypothetical protein DRW42_11840 [Pedobacter miscanthi]
MGNRLGLTTLLLIVLITIGKAQSSYQKTDSTSLALFNHSEWQKLIVYGKNALNNGEDFPLLRLRIAYANFVRENYVEALTHYNQVLDHDKHNQIALYYAYLCNTYLNRNENAGYLASHLDSSVVEGERMSSFRLTDVGAETGIKFTNIYERGNSTFSRAFIDMRLAYKLNLSASYSYYNQPIRNDNISQPGYYARLIYTPFRKISFIGAYHYMRSNLRQLVYQNNAVLAGIKYAGNGSDLQGDFVQSQIGDEKTRQYNLKFIKYISGNLNFYSISRFSVVNVLEENNIVFQQLFGVKPIHNLWLEGVVTLGNQYNYAEADALYIYNGFDKTKFKAGANCYFLLKHHLLLGLSYTFERKSDNIFKFNYLQHSINGGITWNF